MDALSLYNDLRVEIDADEKALLKKKEFAQFLFERLRRDAENTVQRSSSLATSSMSGEDRSVRRTLTQNVSDVIAGFGDEEFVVGDVYDVLLKNGVELPDQPKSKITTVLARFAERGDLVQTFKGGGNVPNRYRRRASEKAQSVDDQQTLVEDDDSLG